jgi:hypothetical protein
MEETMKIVTRIAAVTWFAGALAHAAKPQELTVYLRFRPIDRHLIRSAAQDLATRLFAGIGVSLEWKMWQPGTETLRSTIVVDVVSDTPDDLLPNALGYCEPQEDSHITIFLDRVEKMNYSAYVLAHVLVHEITHVLQGVSRHSATGIMKAHWDVRDVCEMRLRHVSFANEDVRLIRDGLAARQAMGTQDVAR